MLSYLCGEYLVLRFSIPLPGALIGLALLFGLMVFSSSLTNSISVAAKPLLGNMAFFFIPAVMGIAIYWSTLQDNIVSITIAIVGSTILSLGVSYWISKKLLSSRTVLEET
ncbi:CidA/LrgA family protein [Alteromonas sp. ASW11-130]|uniref:CidA/LrgA family protein n=1 Tax=Alteromonas sp. ASW11-130 TaxID=3015775 RepID=UPI002242283D|nr:CidA/LrgA family protein [Alteromonas sp. ASW11-130]